MTHVHAGGDLQLFDAQGLLTRGHKTFALTVSPSVSQKMPRLRELIRRPYVSSATSTQPADV